MRTKFESTATSQGRLLRILRLVNQVGECNSAYNQYARPTQDRYETTVCSYFRSTVEVDHNITLRDGDGTSRTFLRIVREALREPFDVIHAHSLQTACLLLRASGPRAISVRKRAVCTIGNNYQNLSLRNRVLCIPVYSMFGRVVCCGQAGLNSLPWYLRSLARNRLECIPNGVDVERVDRTLAHHVRRHSSETFTVCCVNKLYPIKQPLLLLNVFERVADASCRLVVVGDGPMRDELNRATARSQWHENIKLAGLVPRDQVYQQMSQSDLFVSASRGEGLPVAVLEAMACQCPVVLSDIPPHREIVGDNPRIPLVPPDDVDGFAREIVRLRNLSAEERAVLGRECRRLVETRFPLAALHDRYDAIYRDLCVLN